MLIYSTAIWNFFLKFGINFHLFCVKKNLATLVRRPEGSCSKWCLYEAWFSCRTTPCDQKSYAVTHGSVHTTRRDTEACFMPGLPDFSWSKIPKRGKIYQITTKYIDQMVIKYTKIFHCKTPQNLPKLGFLVWKQTIWQSCFIPRLYWRLARLAPRYFLSRLKHNYGSLFFVAILLPDKNFVC
jgi:hypothetical protein